MDLNRNGLLQFNDFSDMAEQVRSKLELDIGGPEHKKIADESIHLFHQLLADIEPKETQSISQEEWMGFFEDRLGESFDDDVLNTYSDLIYHYFFDFFDQNHDGFITKDEYALFFDIFGIDQKSLETCFQMLDGNGDGKVSRYELLAAIDDFLMSDEEASHGNWTFGDWKLKLK